MPRREGASAAIAVYEMKEFSKMKKGFSMSRIAMLCLTVLTVSAPFLDINPANALGATAVHVSGH